LQPNFLRPDEQFQLNKAISLGVMEFVQNSLFIENRNVRVKWPNDIYIGNKKVAGILIENSVSGNSLQHSIIGIGINVNQEKFSAKLPNPTSLKIEAGKEFNLKECLAQLCSCIENRYLELRANHFPLLDNDYLKNLYRFDEWADYNYKEKRFKAKIVGITKLGKLMLETEKEKIMECDFKEVEFLKSGFVANQ
jgi:BirA family biotin operon repressor/biotin-[acetyl-CoA-carboxylase] ligase